MRNNKYELLKEYLSKSSREYVKLSFLEIEQIIGFELPYSAYKYREWWSNDNSSQSRQSRNWLDIGWKTVEILLDEYVVFQKDSTKTITQENEKSSNSSLYESIEMLLSFTNKQDLTTTVAMLEANLKEADAGRINNTILQENINQDMLKAALLVKKSISQIDVVIHAIGIINALPYILVEDEKVEYLSLGAGNTGRNFDVETSKRIAEFKFINWSGKSDTIRQNSTFKDFFELAEYETNKKKYLYILDKAQVLKFFNNNRSLESVLSKNEATRKHFFSLYGNKYTTVSQYYNDKKNIVEIIDLHETCPDIF